jgi:hypothetical protein
MDNVQSELHVLAGPRRARRHPVAARLRQLAALLLTCVVGASVGAQTVNKEKRFPHPFAVVWQAAIEVVQERGLSIIQVDRDTGIITTDYKSDEEDWRYKFNLRVWPAASSTNVSASCTVESAGSFGLTWENERSQGREDQILRAIAQRLDPNDPGPSVPSPDCLANFKLGGSMARGTSYSSFEDFSGLTPEAAAAALVSSVSRESLALCNGESTTDTYVAIGSIGGRDGAQAEFAITPIGGGVRVSAKHKLPIGRHGRDTMIRDQLCGVVGGIGRFTRVVATPTPSAAQVRDDGTSIETRLRQLEELYKKGLVTPEEYKKKRAELISKL